MLNKTNAAVDRKELLKKVTIEKLVRSALVRDRMAWNELVRRYDPKIRQNIARLFFRADFPFTQDDLDDLVQTFWLRLLDHDMSRLRKFNAKKSPFSAWVWRLARQTAIDHLRVQGKSIAIQDDADPDLEPRGGNWIAMERDW